MNDEQMQPLLEVWLRDREVPRPEVRTSVAKVMAHVPQTRQQGRWWPLTVFDRPAPIPTTNGPMRPRGFTMFSALKFMLASVIVALFGGFLLSGAFTMQQDEEVPPAAVSASPTVEATSAPTEEPTTSVRTDILPGVGLTVEEVEPGVFHVIDDGIRVPRGKGVVAGDDGSIWLTRNDDFLRLGSPQREVHKWPKGSDHALVVTEDGTVWRSYWLNAPEGKDGPDGPRLQFLDDGSWTQLREAKGIEELFIAPDGTLWTLQSWGGPTGHDGPQPNHQVLRLGADGWEPFGDPAPVGGRLFVTPGGGAWLIPLGDMDLGGSMWRYREGSSGWQEVPVDVVFWSFWPGDRLVEVGADGTVWLAGREPLMADGEPVLDGEYPLPGDVFLMRYDGTEWQRWEQADGVPELLSDIVLGPYPSLAQAPDGALWLAEDRIDRFDGSTWQQFLPGHTLGGWDIAPDGSVWLLANGPYGQGLYVITPEAVAE